MSPRREKLLTPVRAYRVTVECLEFDLDESAEDAASNPPPCCVDAVTGDWEPCEAHEREERERQDGGLDAHLALARSGNHGGGW